MSNWELSLHRKKVMGLSPGWARRPLFMEHTLWKAHMLTNLLSQSSLSVQMNWDNILYLKMFVLISLFGSFQVQWIIQNVSFLFKCTPENFPIIMPWKTQAGNRPKFLFLWLLTAAILSASWCLYPTSRSRWGSRCFFSLPLLPLASLLRMVFYGVCLTLQYLVSIVSSSTRCTTCSIIYSAA